MADYKSTMLHIVHAFMCVVPCERKTINHISMANNVTVLCIVAFAELQTEVCDFTSDLNVKGIPYWDYKTYTFKVLFPSLPDHPVMHKEKSVRMTFSN